MLKECFSLKKITFLFIITTSFITASFSKCAYDYSVPGWDINEKNTGLIAAGIDRNTLPVYDGPTVVPAGTTISEKLINRNLDLSAPGIIIEKCLFYRKFDGGWGGSLVNGGSATTVVTLRYCEIDGSLWTSDEVSHSCAFTGGGIIENCYIHDSGSGINFLTCTQELRFEGNYIHNLRAGFSNSGDSSHNSGFTIRHYEGPRVTIKNNRIDCTAYPLGHNTGAVFLQAMEGGPINNIYIEGNLLEGKGYNLVMEYNAYGYSNIHCSNNRFNPTGGGGPAYVQGGAGWDTWELNYMYNPIKRKRDYEGVEVNEPIPF